METIIWPVYIDSSVSRKEGRKISKDDGVEEPKLREITQALRKLKLNYTSDNSKAYPSSWWKKSGRVVVTQETRNKPELLRSVARNVKRIRGESKK